MEEIAEALIVSSNPKDRFFVVNARTMFTGLMVYYFKQGESFIDAVNHILESDLKVCLRKSSKTVPEQTCGIRCYQNSRGKMPNPLRTAW